MFRFYFAIASDSLQPDLQQKRVSIILEAARQFLLSVHCEAHGDVVTLQIETENKIAAAAFKLMVECPCSQDDDSRPDA